jgi:hypothetical protein
MTLVDEAQAILSGLLNQSSLSATAKSGAATPTYDLGLQIPAALAGAGSGVDVPVVDAVPEVDQNVDFTLDLLFEQVRFAESALSDADPLAAPPLIGGMPVTPNAVLPSSAVMSSLPQHGSDAGVPGLLGRLKGSIKLPVTPAVEALNAHVTLTAKVTVLEEHSDGSTTTPADASATQPSIPSSASGVLSEVSLPTSAVSWGRLDVQHPLTTQPRTFSVQVVLTLSGTVSPPGATPQTASAVRTFTLNLPPLPFPEIPVPTVAVLFDTHNLQPLWDDGQTPAKIFVILPFGQIPNDGPSNQHQLARLQVLQTLLDAVHSAQQVVSFPFELTEVLSLGGVPGVSMNLSELLTMNINGQPGSGRIIRYGDTQFPQLNNLDWDHGDFSDTARSLILIGPPNTKLQLFNDFDFNEDEGHLEVKTGHSLFTIVPDLASPAALAVNGSDGSVSTPHPAEDPNEQFDKHVSSVRLDLGDQSWS